MQHLAADLDEGLIASADREGFVQNGAFREMWDVVRGAIEAIAFVDRQVQSEQETGRPRPPRRRHQGGNPGSHCRNPCEPKHRPIGQNSASSTSFYGPKHSPHSTNQGTKSREQQLLIMSLLGIVAGFMTHEFGAALQEVEDAKKQLADLDDPAFTTHVDSLSRHSDRMREFMAYSTGFIRGSRHTPNTPYNAATAAKPRHAHVPGIRDPA